jgi:hypothetical protein
MRRISQIALGVITLHEQMSRQTDLLLAAHFPTKLLTSSLPTVHRKKQMKGRCSVRIERALLL